jgi:hypothetical protein
MTANPSLRPFSTPILSPPRSSISANLPRWPAEATIPAGTRSPRVYSISNPIYRNVALRSTSSTTGSPVFSPSITVLNVSSDPTG